MMTALDYYNYQHDMEERAQADYEAWVWTQECEYWYLVLILVISECPHILRPRETYEGMPY